jgi:hypothetical protein
LGLCAHQQRRLFAVSFGTCSQFSVFFFSHWATAAEKGDDRVSDAHASQHCDIYHNGSSRFGGNAGSAETADLRPCTHSSETGKLVAAEGAGDIDDPHAEMVGDRDINYDGTTVLDDITRCYEAVSADVSSA